MIVFYYSYAKCAKRQSETIKQELLDSLIDVKNKDETGLDNV